ncbi:metallophosphoesterase [Kiloniella sp.]|uniref:metallophosphoesterase n=1 Tax=Kiloniella sp. TaxID=1938587 RepID=UPI003B0160E1
MKLELSNGEMISVLGDPHLGRSFIHGVPLHRRGDREAEQWAEFERHLNDVEGVDYHICVGDLFDKFVVSHETLFKAVEVYTRAALRNTDVTYYVIRGNHDGSRDAEKVSSFDLFSALINSDFAEYTIRTVVNASDAFGPIAFVPWHPFTPAVEMVQQLPELPFEYIFGHWDIDSFGHENPNLVPLEELAKRTKHIVTGHIHTPEEREPLPGVKLTVTGSMLPYSHSEDPKAEKYVSLTLKQLDELDLESLKNKCVRILLNPGEDVPDIDCLQLTTKRIETKEDQEPEEVVIEDFNLKALFSDVMTEFKVDASVVEEAWQLVEAQKGVEA